MGQQQNARTIDFFDYDVRRSEREVVVAIPESHLDDARANDASVDLWADGSRQLQGSRRSDLSRRLLYYLAVLNVPAMVVVHVIIFAHLLRGSASQTGARPGTRQAL
jgi:hypothetical protein